MTEKNTISSIEKAVDILEILSRENNKSIRSLGEDLGITKSTLHRILKTLEIRGLVRKDSSTEKYTLGYKILELSTHLSLQNDLRNIALEHMKKLADATNETVQLAVIDHENILVIETVEGYGQLRVYAKAGEKYPITYGNFGKVFLSKENDLDNISKWIEKYPLQQYASKSIMDQKEYIKHIKEVKENKISIGIDDPIEGAISIAVPIENKWGDIIAVLAIAGVKTEDKLNNLDELMTQVKQYGVKITQELGK
ncbi:IclR family transcriptional regulator [Mammaliicoccus sciuri]|uniref:IclR family transcriptional regulator n=2 Tax=Mammaliicoccus sciuri TaxID=1296 RepID=UPI001E2ED879|nr:IclR family transcriptional regulator [Mammaliicoccus sciuri]MCD8874085.1 IclR family transcriptional regulator [Mammaliicoccus sciuri]